MLSLPRIIKLISYLCLVGVLALIYDLLGMLLITDHPVTIPKSKVSNSFLLTISLLLPFLVKLFRPHNLRMGLIFLGIGIAFSSGISLFFPLSDIGRIIADVISAAMGLIAFYYLRSVRNLEVSIGR